MRVRSVAVGVVLLLAVLSACGGSSSAADRISGCEQRFLDGMQKGSDGAAAAIARSETAKKSATALCTDAERAGVLNDDGDTSAANVKAVLADNPDVLSPICEASFRAGLGTNSSQVEAYLPAGGLHALTAKLCDNLAPYVTATGFDQTALFKDRGRAVVVPVCVAGSFVATKDQSLPFSKADATKLFTRICGASWDQGLLRPNGSVDSAGVKALAAKITRQMVASGEITVQR